MGEKNRGMFFVMIVIMFILFLSLISIIFDLIGKFFVFEFLLLLLFLLVGVIFTVGIYTGGNWVWSGLLVFFGANLINLSFLYWGKAGFSSIILPLIVGVLGFLIAMVKKGSDEEEELDVETEVEVEEPVEEKEAPKVKDIKVNFSPGKYVASETGKKYHIPKCDWAKKINKKRILWFDDKAEAKKKGYLPCKCVK